MCNNLTDYISNRSSHCEYELLKGKARKIGGDDYFVSCRHPPNFLPSPLCVLRLMASTLMCITRIAMFKVLTGKHAMQR
jgi:hypothetical protein